MNVASTGYGQEVTDWLIRLGSTADDRAPTPGASPVDAAPDPGGVDAIYRWNRAMTPSPRYHERAEFHGHVATLPASPTSAATARKLVRRLLHSDADEAQRANIELLTSELVTNAVVHAGTELRLRLHYPRHDVVRVEITDQGNGTPAMQPGAPTDPSGRGLQLVDAVANEWGTADATPAGKTVWFETSL